MWARIGRIKKPESRAGTGLGRMGREKEHLFSIYILLTMYIYLLYYILFITQYYASHASHTPKSSIHAGSESPRKKPLASHTRPIRVPIIPNKRYIFTITHQASGYGRRRYAKKIIWKKVFSLWEQTQQLLSPLQKRGDLSLTTYGRMGLPLSPSFKVCSRSTVFPTRGIKVSHIPRIPISYIGRDGAGRQRTSCVEWPPREP